jgi:hypothetical protein
MELDKSLMKSSRRGRGKYIEILNSARFEDIDRRSLKHYLRYLGQDSGKVSADRWFRNSAFPAFVALFGSAAGCVYNEDVATSWSKQDDIPGMGALALTGLGLLILPPIIGYVKGKIASRGIEPYNEFKRRADHNRETRKELEFQKRISEEIAKTPDFRYAL